MNQVWIMFVAPFGAAGFMLLACWIADRLSRRAVLDKVGELNLQPGETVVFQAREKLSTTQTNKLIEVLTDALPNNKAFILERGASLSAQEMRLDDALAIVLTFDGHSLAMSMEEIKTLNRARQVVDESANLLIGREPKKFGGRHG